jgi:hypothetical protein
VETFEGRLKRNRIYRKIEVNRELNKSGERGKGVMITEGKIWAHVKAQTFYYNRNSFNPRMKQFFLLECQDY